MSRSLQFLWRGVRRRCALCGEGPLFTSWFTMRESCPHCGFWLEREEGYFTGAIGLNLVVAELLFVSSFMGSVYLTWPKVPWEMMYGWIPVAVLAPLFFYPFSKSLWLAADLFIHSPEPHEFEPANAPVSQG
ncbi:MAG: DUF983 domain-containing protein [Chloroflexi bacterium]|nr:DUF983 domain-containing protein [Chloroflexota bacterium]